MRWRRLAAAVIASGAMLSGNAGLALAGAPAEGAAGLEGDWHGKLIVEPPVSLDLHVRRTGEDLSATLDSPERGVMGVPVDDLRRDGAKVSFGIKAVGFRFEGELGASGQEIRGVVSQGAAPQQPLILQRGPPAAAAPAAPTAAAPAPASAIPSADEVRQTLRARLGPLRQGVGAMVGVLRPDGKEEFLAEGFADPAAGAPVAPSTVFAVDSVTKVVTGLLLADMVVRGEVRLDDPVDRYLPPGVRAPGRGGRKITLLDLATHTAGFPADPPDVNESAPETYSAERLNRFVSGFQLTRDPGSAWEYSGVGMALLGEALARRGGADFGTLAAARITGPLHMASTSVDPGPDMRRRLAVGHDFALRPVGHAPAGAYDASNGLYSTAQDLLTLVKLYLGEGPRQLRRAAALQLATRRPIGRPGVEQALGWELQQLGPPGSFLAFKTGASRGYSAFVAFRPDKRDAVVVLLNARTALAPDDIGLFVLAGRPLPPPAPPAVVTERQAITLAPALLARCVGRYRLTPQLELVLTVEDGRLFGALSGRSKVELFAQSPTRFFARALDAVVDVELAPDGSVTGLRLRINGQEMTAARSAAD